jgi:spore germination cell wall hydrolase CwlJ-like protein
LDAESSKPRQATLGPGPDGRDYLIRTLVFEASGETEIGKVAVAHVILNRKRSGRWGHKIEDVVTSPWQFEPWMTRKSEIEGLSRSDPRYVDAAEIADGVLAGYIPDPTAGATHFLNPVIVRKRRGGSLPSWADSDGQPIGRHVFYCPECEGSKSTQAAAVEIVGTAGMRKEG